MPRKNTSTALSSPSVLALGNQIQLRAALPRSVVVDRAAGVLRGVAVITAGLTKPDGLGNEPMNVDAVTLQQVAAAINASPTGVKVRVTHPELKGDDDLPFRIGFIASARVVGGKVLADVTFHDSDDVDARRIMAIAERDPSSAGLSIISTNIRLEQNSLRVQSLDAVDFVGSPAANPAGMLSARPKGSTVMTPEQIAYLVSLGLPENATPEQAKEFADKQTPEQLAAMPKAEPATDASADDKHAAAADPPAAAPAPVAAAASAPTAAPAVALSGAEGDTDACVKAALKAERGRQKEIRAIALKCGFDEKWINTQIDGDVALDAVRQVALAALQRDPQSMQTSTITVGADLNRDTLGDAVQDAIMLRAGNRQLVQFDEAGSVCLSADRTAVARKPHDRSNEFRGHSLVEMGRRFLVSLGCHEADRMGKAALADLLMSRSRMQAALPGVYFAHSTGDFPGLLADAMGKVLRGEYALAPHTWDLWCRRTTAPDFKDIKALQLSEAADLAIQPEGDDVTYGLLTESKETYALSTFSKGIKFTRQMLINDDLSAFSRIPGLMGRAASRNVESLAVAILTANAAMADGDALFHGNHGNLSTGPLSVNSLGSSRSLMKRQTALGSSDPLELTPRYLIVPETISTEAEQLVSSTVDPAKSNATNNPFANKLQVIPSARLDLNSTAQWYLLADPAEIDTVEVAFLEGEESPVVMEEDEFDSDCRKIKVRHNVQAKAIDWRGMVRSSGA